MTVAIGSEHKSPRAAHLPNRRRPHRIAKLLDRRVGRDDIRRQGEHDDETENGEAENGASVLAERRPERRQRRGLGEDGRRVFSNRGGERGGVSGHGESADR